MHIDFIFLKPKVSFSWSKRISHGYLRKDVPIISIIGFHLNQSVWASIEKRKPSLCVWLRPFLNWHSRTSLYLTIAWFEKHCSKVNFFISFNEWILSKSRVTRTVWVQDVLDVCELFCNKGCYFVTVCPFSGLSKNPTRVGRGFFTSVRLEVFHIKILCSLFPQYLPTA